MTATRPPLLIRLLSAALVNRIVKEPLRLTNVVSNPRTMHRRNESSLQNCELIATARNWLRCWTWDLLVPCQNHHVPRERRSDVHQRWFSSHPEVHVFESPQTGQRITTYLKLNSRASILPAYSLHSALFGRRVSKIPRSLCRRPCRPRQL